MNLYSFVRRTGCRILAKVVFPSRACGQPSSMPQGPVVLCANHLSFADVILLIAHTDRPIRFMAKKELFKIPVLGPFLRAMGAFPVNRGGMDVNSVKVGISSLSQGEVLGVFPQGTRCAGVSPDQTCDKLYNGASMMAHRTKAALLPVAIQTKNFKVRPFRKVRVIYGEPIPFEKYSLLEGYGRNNYAAVTKYLFDRICAMANNPPEN